MATKLVNALARQRVLAKVIDILVPAAAVLVAYLLGDGTSDLVIALGIVLVYCIGVLVWEATTGRTPGNAVLGIATVSSTGGAPGFGAVIVRSVVLVVSNVVPLVGPLVLLVSNTWDRDGQRRGWHDKLVGTYVLDVRAGRDPLQTGGLRGESAIAASDAVPHLDDGARGDTVAAAERRRGDPLADGRRSATADATWPGSPGAAPNAPAALNTPAVAVAPAAPAAFVDGAVPSTSGLNAPASGGAAERAADGTPAVGTPAVGTPAVGEAAADAPAEEAARATASAPAEAAGAPADRAPAGAPAGPGARQRVLVFDDGTEVEIAGQALIGRNPEPRLNEAVNYLINFADLNRSVSKTHLRLELDEGSVWVTDRGSTNGSFVVDRAGTEQPLHAEVAMLLPADCSVRFGDRRFTIR